MLNNTLNDIISAGDNMIKGRYTYFDSDETSVALEIRNKVFTELSLPDKDELDSISVHGIVYYNETVPVAAGRITYLDGKFKLSRLAVLSEFRRKKIGDFLVRMLVDKVFCSGAKSVYSDVPIKITPFLDSIGFEKIDDIFEKDGIQYQPMCLRLENFRTGCGHAYCPSINK